MFKLKCKKQCVYYFCLIVLVSYSAISQADCFIIQELNGPVRYIEGECQKQVSPCSTFKIPLALMGFESGILKDKQTPSWDFKPEYEKRYRLSIDKWKSTHTPSSWIENSCIWYSQVLTQKLGMDKFKQYLKMFNYGNQDVSGDIGMNNGLTNAWLSSSLKISPVQQIEFLAKLLNYELSVTQHSIDSTKEILFFGKINKYWQLYGKTGSGFQLNSEGNVDMDRQLGWFVGWIINASTNKKYIFTYLVQDTNPEKTIAGLRAKEQAQEKIKKFIAQNL